MEFILDTRVFVSTVLGQAGGFRDALAQQPVGVLVDATLPGTGRGADGGLDADVAGTTDLARYLGALIQGQGLAQLLGQFAQACTESNLHHQRVVRKEAQQLHAPGIAFHEGPYGRSALRADDRIPFPSGGHGAVLRVEASLLNACIGRANRQNATDQLRTPSDLQFLPHEPLWQMIARLLCHFRPSESDRDLRLRGLVGSGVRRISMHKPSVPGADPFAYIEGAVNACNLTCEAVDYFSDL